MSFRQIFMMIVLTAVVAEFGFHVVYHALTGRHQIDEDGLFCLKSAVRRALHGKRGR